MEIKFEFLKSKNVTLGPILPHTCFVDMFSRHIGFFLEPSLKWRVILARELSKCSFRAFLEYSQTWKSLFLKSSQTVASCSWNQTILGGNK